MWNAKAGFEVSSFDETHFFRKLFLNRNGLSRNI